MGVRPTAPGYSDIIIQLNLCNLKWLEGNVPTPRGIIFVKVFHQKSHLIIKVKLPVSKPMLKSRVNRMTLTVRVNIELHRNKES